VIFCSLVIIISSVGILANTANAVSTTAISNSSSAGSMNSVSLKTLQQIIDNLRQQIQQLTLLIQLQPKANNTFNVNVIIPSAADVSSCITNTGTIMQTTGTADYAKWFLWNGCAKEKTYSTVIGQPIVLKAFGDECHSCVCTNPNFTVSEYRNNSWTPIAQVGPLTNGEFLYTGKTNAHYFIYTPQSNSIKITASSCFISMFIVVRKRH